MASHMNDKKKQIVWNSGSLEWDSASMSVDVHMRARICAAVVASGLAISEGQHYFHYVSCKGFAGRYVCSNMIIKWMAVVLLVVDGVVCFCL